MKNLKLLCVLLVACVLNVSYAQDRRFDSDSDRAARIKAQQEQMIAKLDLSEDQAVAMKEIMEDYRNKMQKTREDNMGDRVAMMTAMKALRTEQETEIKDILTADQFKTFQTLMEERRGKRRQRLERRPERG
ncbi:MAG: hypothetical protein AAFO94_09835 [Bacteroidota bacterium]